MLQDMYYLVNGSESTLSKLIFTRKVICSHFNGIEAEHLQIRSITVG